MALAHFKIEEAHEEIKSIPKLSAFAGVHFSVTIDGKQVPLPSMMTTYHGALKIHLGTGFSHEINECGLYLTKFGLTRAQSSDENARLVRWKPKLEAGFIQLAQKLTSNTAERPLTKKDPLTGEQVVIVPEAIKQDVVVEYAFIDPTFDQIEKKVQIPDRLFFYCLCPPPEQEIVGRAGDLCVRFCQGAKGFDANVFSFDSPGWISHSVAQMRAKFSDAIIEAAFKDLASKWIALDSTPKDAIAWSGVTKTSFTLV